MILVYLMSKNINGRTNELNNNSDAVFRGGWLIKVYKGNV